MVREIFQRKKGKDFYRDQLEYLEYDEEYFSCDKEDWKECVKLDDDEIAHKVAMKCE